MFLLGDRTGDVRGHLCQTGNEGSFALGSIIITSICMVGANHVATTDRDDKVRVSAWPDTRRIESYCLGHQSSFVAAVCDLTSSNNCASRQYAV